MIGDCETAALVSREGSIDWLCWPNFSSGACFAALLGTRENGYWKIAPKGKVKGSSRRYEGHTLVAETTFTTSRGEVVVTDFMLPRGRHSHLLRVVRGVRGRVAMRMELALRFDYGRTIPWVTSKGDELRAVSGPDMVVLRTKAPLRGEGMKTVSDFTVGPGQKVVFTLSYGSSLEVPPARVDSQKALAQTREYWKRWSRRSKYRGAYAEAVERSLMTLKALTYRPSGGIVAAVTTSLPERIGGLTQLGLSLLLAARHGIHAARADAGRLRRRGSRVEAVAFARCSGNARPGADDLRAEWRAPTA